MVLSIIVPIYNVEKYIEKCVQSIASQTYSDFEVIFVNDGSNDNSINILMNVLEKFPILNYKIVNKENEGLPQARKTGFENSIGEYITFIDSDDFVDKDFYHNCMKYVLENDLDLFNTGYLIDYFDGKMINKSICDSFLIVNQYEYINLIHQRKVFHTMWSKIIKRDLFKVIDFPFGNFMGEDYATIIPAIRKVNKIGLIPESGYHYRFLRESMGRGSFTQSKREGFFMYKECYPQVCNWYPESLKYINSFYCVEFMAVITSMARNKQYDDEIIIFIKKFLKNKMNSVLYNDELEIKYKLSIVPTIIMPKLFSRLYCLFFLKHS